MKIRLTQNYNNRELLAGMVIDQELPEKVKLQLVKDGKAVEVDKPKAVKHGKK